MMILMGFSFTQRNFVVEPIMPKVPVKVIITFKIKKIILSSKSMVSASVQPKVRPLLLNCLVHAAWNRNAKIPGQQQV